MVYHVYNWHLEFHKVVYRHYSGELENVHIILHQIYSRNGVPNFIEIAPVLCEIIQKHFGLFLSVHSVVTVKQHATLQATTISRPRT